MSHNHNNENNKSTENIAIAFFLNFGFTIIEGIGGMLTNSVAILSDAVHDLGDSVSLGLAWYFDKVAQRKPTARYTYGYKRFSLLGALINCLILLIGSSWVVYESVSRLFDPQSVSAKGMLWLAVLGVIVNGAAAFKTGLGEHLRRKRTSSQGGTSHGVNERVVSLHLLEDVLGWLAVLVVSVVMLFVDLPILDPILSIGIACFILFNVVRNLRSAFMVILQGVPEDVDIDQIKSELLSLPYVQDIHDLHLWSLDSCYTIASLHVVTLTWQQEQLLELKSTIKKQLKSHNIQHTTVEFETPDEECHPCN